MQRTLPRSVQNPPPFGTRQAPVSRSQIAIWYDSRGLWYKTGPGFWPLHLKSDMILYDSRKGCIGMADFFIALFGSPTAWGAEQWSLLLAVLALLYHIGRTGLKVLRWVRRGFKPEPEPVQTVRIADPDPAPVNRFTFPKIQPPRRDRQLVARAQELLQIASLLETQKGVQITGQKGVAVKAEGGRGKTALAAEFAQRHGPRYDGGWWIRAQSRQTLFADLAALGTAAFGKPTPDPIPEAHVRAVLAAVVSSGARWLLVYDNVDDHKDIRDFICAAPGIDVIVTTRRAKGWDGYARIDLEALDVDTPEGGATALLLQEARMPRPLPEQRADAWQAAKVLGGLPLALVMGGALVREEGWSFARLR